MAASEAVRLRSMMANYWPKPCSVSSIVGPPKAKVTRSNRIGRANFPIL
jgi:hypothetical protein